MVYGKLMKMLHLFYFRIATQKHVVKIDSKSVISNLMGNTTVLHHATVLKRKSEKTI